MPLPHAWDTSPLSGISSPVFPVRCDAHQSSVRGAAETQTQTSTSVAGEVRRSGHPFTPGGGVSSPPGGVGGGGGDAEPAVTEV